MGRYGGSILVGEAVAQEGLSHFGSSNNKHKCSSFSLCPISMFCDAACTAGLTSGSGRILMNIEACEIWQRPEGAPHSGEHELQVLLGALGPDLSQVR